MAEYSFRKVRDDIAGRLKEALLSLQQPKIDKERVLAWLQEKSREEEMYQLVYFPLLKITKYAVRWGSDYAHDLDNWVVGAVNMGMPLSMKKLRNEDMAALREKEDTMLVGYFAGSMANFVASELMSTQEQDRKWQKRKQPLEDKDGKTLELPDEKAFAQPLIPDERQEKVWIFHQQHDRYLRGKNLCHYQAVDTSMNQLYPELDLLKQALNVQFFVMNKEKHREPKVKDSVCRLCCDPEKRDRRDNNFYSDQKRLGQKIKEFFSLDLAGYAQQAEGRGNR